MGNRAGIKDINIRIVLRGHQLEPGLNKPTGNCFALRLIELASYGLKSNG